MIRQKLTIEQIAEIYQVHPETAMRWARTGVLKHLNPQKIGKRWYFDNGKQEDSNV